MADNETGMETVFGESAPESAVEAAESADKVEAVDGRTLNFAGGTAAPREPGGRPEHIPAKFWKATAADPTLGEVNTEAWAKAWKDAETFASRLKAENDEFRKGEKVGSAPDKVEDYWTGYDTAALAKAAPKAFQGGEADNATLVEFFKAAQGAGLPTDKARAMFGAFMGGLHGAIPDEKPAAEQRKEAIASLGPHGAKMAEDVKGYLTEMHKRAPFTAAELNELEEMVRHGPTLSLLYSLSRGRTSGRQAPPAAPAGVSDVHTEDEITQAMQSPRYRTDDAYRERIDQALMRSHAARNNGAGGTSSSVSRTITLGG